MDSYYQSRCQNASNVVDRQLSNVSYDSRKFSNVSYDSFDSCSVCCDILARQKISKETAEQIRNGAMLWIGFYVAGASLICSLAMAADLFLGFRHKKLWIPCKFFTLNALFLTLLAVGTKLTVDLSTDMSGYPDKLAKISSSVFICTVMGNFMPSLGQMNDNELFMNIAALGVLVVTILVNLLIAIVTGLHISHIFFGELLGLPFTIMEFANLLITPVILVLLVLMSSSALYISFAKKYIDSRYREIHKTSSIEESDIIRKFNVDTLRESVRKYWMMAQTGSPQFVMVRSVTCVASEVICILAATILAVIEIYLYTYLDSTFGVPHEPHLMFIYDTSYKWTTCVIFVIQTIGVGVGTIACAFRVFTTIKLKFLGLRGKSLKAVFEIEEYWIEGLVEWKQKPLPLNIRSQKWKKIVHNTKNLLLTFCIRVQFLIVVVSKSIQLLLVFLTGPFLKRKRVPNSSASSNYSSLDSTTARKMDLTHYVLLLEGENEMPERMLKSICDSVDRLILMGKKQEPKKLKELLKKSTSFRGVAEFDNDQIPSLVSYDPPNSWMMPLVTLTTIAVALPNITNQMIEGLIRSVSEGLVYIGLVEKDLDEKGDLIKVRNAAKVMWVEVELHRTWLDQDLRKMATIEKNSKKILESLAGRAKKSIEEFKEKANKTQKENPLQWPVEAIAANSMYRISNTLMMEFDLNNEQSEEELFKKLSVMISDILTACLTNLPRVITMKCFCNVVEKREESVQQAAHLLGETEEILKILQQRELPILNQDQATCIDEWRAIMKQDHNLVFASSSSNGDAASSGSHEIHLDVEKEAY